MSNHKPTLCLDFDGAIHSYTSGWQGADVVTDPPVPGALDFLVKAVLSFQVAIYSSRSGQEGGIKAMKEWLKAQYRASDRFDWGTYTTQFFVEDEIQWPTDKPPAHLTIDDRAWCFEGTFPSIEEIKEFKPWNKKEN